MGEIKIDGQTVMTNIIKTNKQSTSDALTINSSENAMIVGPFTGTSVTVNGNLCVTRSLTLTGTLTVATGKTLQVI